MTYYNTNELEGRALLEARMKAHKLPFEILKVFRDMRIPLAPHQVHDLLPNGFAIPLTSVRRAMADLTEGYFLVKMDKEDMVMGTYGSPVHKWGLV